MIDTLRKLFGFGPGVDFAELVNSGGIILDVRTKEEYQGGHIQGSRNISVDVLQKNLNQLKKDQVIITCCASGMRSASAKSILTSNGFQEVYNGGGWMSLQKKLH